MDLYKVCFSEHEQRERHLQTDIMENEEYHFNLIYENDIWVGEILWWETADFIYVAHFCILPEMRGRRYGQKALALLDEEGKTVILEIDPPVDDVSIHLCSSKNRTHTFSICFSPGSSIGKCPAPSRITVFISGFSMEYIKLIRILTPADFASFISSSTSSL
ncbi:GNAT family N-acetyltransferase [Hungatella hathewayi]|uniref:GNAT family N-acetyltransferase n=2 Tax=Hungatella TaxID=1649459 RepID=UPI00325BF4F1